MSELQLQNILISQILRTLNYLLIYANEFMNIF